MTRPGIVFQPLDKPGDHALGVGCGAAFLDPHIVHVEDEVGLDDAPHRVDRDDKVGKPLAVAFLLRGVEIKGRGRPKGDDRDVLWPVRFGRNTGLRSSAASCRQQRARCGRQCFASTSESVPS
jgi:hypothetical protein